MTKCLVPMLMLTAMIACTDSARAEPILQLYLEGATYSSATESWELGGLSGGDTVRLWAIGNVDGPGGKGAIDDVHLSVVYDTVAVEPVIQLTPAKTDGFGGFADPSVPVGTGTLIQTVTDGSLPVLGDGSSLPSHGEYGPGKTWQEFDLGDFTLTDSHIANFISSFPSNPTTLGAQINVYEIAVTGGAGLSLHFDLYDTIVAMNHVKFAPFSHDATTVVPLPGAFWLGAMGIGLVGGLRGWRN